MWNAYSNSEDVRTGPGPTSDEWESTNLSFPSKGYGKWESTRQYADHQNDLGNFSSLVYDLAFFNSVLVATFRWSPRHVARTQTAVPFLASGPTIYPSFGPRSGPTSAYPLNLVRQVGQSLWVSLRSSLETEESFQSAVMSICSDQSYLLSRSMVESLLTNRVSFAFSVCLYNSELPPPKITTRPDKSWKDQRGKRPDQFWLFIPEHGFARGIIA